MVSPSDNAIAQAFREISYREDWLQEVPSKSRPPAVGALDFKVAVIQRAAEIDASAPAGAQGAVAWVGVDHSIANWFQFTWLDQVEAERRFASHVRSGDYVDPELMPLYTDPPAASEDAVDAQSCETCGLRDVSVPNLCAALDLLADFNPGADEYTNAIDVLRNGMRLAAAQADTKDAEFTRKQFERWLSKRWGYSTERWADSGNYHSGNTREWWECWQTAIDAARDGEGVGGG